MVGCITLSMLFVGMCVVGMYYTVIAVCRDVHSGDMYYTAIAVCRDGCSGHFNSGYNYLRLKYELELDLEKMNEEQLNRISRLCSELAQPPSAFMIVSHPPVCIQSELS